jgi:hypothetical protein
MTKFTRKSSTAVDGSTNHHGTTDAGAKCQHQHCFATAPGAQSVFGERSRVGIIVDGDVDPELLLELLAHRDVASGNVGSPNKRSGVVLDQPGDSDPTSEDLPALSQLLNGRNDPGHHQFAAFGSDGATLVDNRPVVLDADSEELGPSHIDADGAHSTSIR